MIWSRRVPTLTKEIGASTSETMTLAGLTADDEAALALQWRDPAAGAFRIAVLGNTGGTPAAYPAKGRSRPMLNPYGRSTL